MYVNQLDWLWADPDGARVMRHIGAIGRVVTYDRGGTGLSDPVRVAPTMEERADELLAVLDAAQMARVDLVGVLDGAAIAVYVAATRPERVRSLLLVNPWVKGRDNGKDPPGITEWAWQEWDAAIDRWGEGSTIDVALPSLKSSPLHRRAMAVQERTAAAPGTVRALAEAAKRVDVTAVLPSVHVPTLVVANLHDRVLPIAQARYVATTVPGARIVEFDGMDSAVHYEHPDEFLAVIDEFYGARIEAGASDRLFATVVFSDIVGSTEQLGRMGDRAWHELLRSHDSVTRQLIERHDGIEIKSTGDGFFVSFTDAEGAVRFGLGLVASVRELGVEVRVGVHAGEVQHSVGDDVSGMTVHAAARICSTASASEVLVSEPVREVAMDSELTFTDRGRHELRGAPGSWRLYLAALSSRQPVRDTARLATPADKLQQAIIRRAPILGRIVARVARRAHKLTSA